MSQSFSRIQLRKDAFKFSSAHMTVFPDGTKESLHGHNYTVEVQIDVKDISFEKMVPFSKFKTIIKRICDSWDEKVLLAEKCPFFEIRTRSKTEIDFDLCGKHYVLPYEEILLLNLDNITSEALAGEFCSKFLAAATQDKIDHSFSAIQVRIEETAGQGSTFLWKHE